jgi:[pyruvate, water dikinase]-phosphate phosphotransferase / [pyruvate, water dikinase] kinase
VDEPVRAVVECPYQPDRKDGDNGDVSSATEFSPTPRLSAQNNPLGGSSGVAPGTVRHIFGRTRRGVDNPIDAPNPVPKALWMISSPILHLHLVSDATGETNHQIARACLVQFDGVRAKEHVWSLVRTRSYLEKVITGLEAHPGPVLFTLVEPELRRRLEEACRRLEVPCISVLDPILSALGSHLGVQSHGRPGRQHEMDAAYFRRIEAMDFTLAHDDGQLVHDLEEADIVVVGVSRTSKTPTSLYLANRGYKTANVPIVPGIDLPDELFHLKNPLVIAFTTDPTRLIQVRRNRVLMLKQREETDYVALERVRKEVSDARRLFERQKWPVIDVTRRSIEETAAAVLQHLEKDDADNG